ncbi:unnamed protein product [Somion occarium]|uniref:Uncharacterized protein n=1 Tax=Somion occarium TaxID=3059160 RepID=A0ABP1DTI1_9APHY
MQYLDLPLTDDRCSMSFTHSSLSRSTIPGPGVTTGKFLMAVGGLVRKGIEAFAIQRRLTTISSQLRPGHTQAADEHICGDLLEFARRDLYSTRIKAKAWSLILLIILEGNTTDLVHYLLKWDEADMFLMDILKYMPSGWIHPRRDSRYSLEVNKSLRHLQQRDSSLAFRVIRFFTQLTEAEQMIIKTDEEAIEEADAISFSPFVSASGKMDLGPGVYLQGMSIQRERLSLSRLIKSIICARLNTISSILPLEMGSSAPTKQIINLHAEVLEVFRVTMYDKCVQRQTCELLFISISRFHAVSLVRVLVTWSRRDLRLFIIHIMRWLQPFVQKGCPPDSSLPKAYRAYLANHVNGQHPVVPFLYFLTQLCRASPVAASLCLDVDLIKLLKCMCLNDFPNPATYTNTSVRVNRTAISDVHAVSSMLLAALSTHPQSCIRLLRSRDVPRWFLSLYYSPDFLGLPDAPLLQSIWLDMDVSILKFILVAMEYVLKGNKHVSPQEADYLPLESIYRDIVTILRENNAEPDIMYSASDSFLRCIAIGGEFRRLMDVVLAESRSEETLSIILTVLKSLGLYTFLPTALSPLPLSEQRRPLHDIRRYMNRLARFYADELRSYTILVAELTGSQACNARYMLIDAYQNNQRWLSTDAHSTTSSSSSQDALGHSYPMQISSEQNVTIDQEE